MPRASRSDVSYAKLTLPYPIFAVDFDPYNRGYLVVGGGGGEGRSGVPNQISVLDVSNRAAISTAVDIELSREEDNVQSLGTLATRDGLIVFAGINSSEADQEQRKNEHLRSFSVTYPPRKKQRTETSELGEKEKLWQLLGKRSLLSPSTAARKETYQRILRLSPSQKRESGSRRIGAVASGLARDSEVIVFNATNPTPDADDILTRIELTEGKEAADLDIAAPEESTFSLAYCTDYDIYEQIFAYDFASKCAEKTPKGPRRVFHGLSPDGDAQSTARPKFRCLRFLDSQNVLAVANKPNKSGAELRIFHLYPTGPATMVMQKTLPSRVKQVTSMDVCALGADGEGNQQFAIAVAGQDISIEVFTTNYRPSTATFSNFRKYLTMRDVHPQQMTKLAFSPFHTPTQTSTTSAPQFLRLASVSYGNTVVVDTFPLQQSDPQDKRSRYVLSHPSDEVFATATYIFIGSIIMLVLAFLFQSFQTGGFANDDKGAFRFLPKKARDFLDKPAAVAYGHDVRWADSSVSSASLSASSVLSSAGSKMSPYVAPAASSVSSVYSSISSDASPYIAPAASSVSSAYSSISSDVSSSIAPAASSVSSAYSSVSKDVSSSIAPAASSASSAVSSASKKVSSSIAPVASSASSVVSSVSKKAWWKFGKVASSASSAASSTSKKVSSSIAPAASSASSALSSASNQASSSAVSLPASGSSALSSAGIQASSSAASISGSASSALSAASDQVSSSASSLSDAVSSIIEPLAVSAIAAGRPLASVVSAHGMFGETSALDSVVSSASDSEPSSTKAIVVRPASPDSTGVAVDVHDDKDALLEQDSDAKHWHELEKHQQARWKEKLKEAGHWLESEGESVLKGLLFSEYAGAIGGVVGDVLREL